MACLRYQCKFIYLLSENPNMGILMRQGAALVAP